MDTPSHCKPIEANGRSGVFPRIAQWMIPLIFCIVIGFTLSDFSITWDEPAYCSSGISHGAWFRQPSWQSIDAYWSPVHDHPPAGTIMAGFLRYVFHVKLGWLQDITACRLQTLFFVFILHFSLFALGKDLFGPWVAFMASVLFFVLPRAFFHAHLVALDYPVASFWVAAVWLYLRGLQSQRWMAAASVILGFGILTKINAFFLYALLIPWTFRYFRNSFSWKREEGLRGFLRRTTPCWSRLLLIIVIPSLMFLLFWPWLWPSPWERTLGYFMGQLTHFTVPTYYFGQAEVSAPWHYPFVMIAFTTPVLILLPAVWGLGRLVFGRYGGSGVFLALNFLLPVSVLAFLTPCKYNGIRLFLTAMPFLCLAAAVALKEGWAAMRIRSIRWASAVSYALLLVLTVGCALWHYHPHQLAYYNLLIGGLPGAHKAGFDIDYWGSSYGKLRGWISERPEARFWVPICIESLTHYNDLGLQSPPARLQEEAEGADYMLLLNAPAGFTPRIWHVVKEQVPVHVIALDGVPLLSVYALEEKSASRNIAIQE